MTTTEVARMLRHVVDPELGLDIVALGLVYAIEVEPAGVTVRMTTTSPDCPMSDALVGMTEAVLQYSLQDGEPRVELVNDPPWNIRMAEPAVLRHLGLIPA